MGCESVAWTTSCFPPDQPQTAVFSCLKYRPLKRVPAIHYTRGFLSRSIRHFRCDSMTRPFTALLPRAATGSTDQTICGEFDVSGTRLTVSMLPSLCRRGSCSDTAARRHRDHGHVWTPCACRKLNPGTRGRSSHSIYQTDYPLSAA
jgi:hypothetical protein